MNVVLSIEAIQPPLAGIGRYVWELATRLPQLNDIESIRYISDGIWRNLPRIESEGDESYSTQSPNNLSEPVLNYKGRLRKKLGQLSIVSKFYSKIQPLMVEFRLQNLRHGVFHGPNYFVPNTRMARVVTIHDLSIYRYPHWHPNPRVDRMRALIPNSVKNAQMILTDSLVTRQEVIDEFNLRLEQVCAIPLGVDGNYFPRTRENLELVLSSYDLSFGGYSLFVSTIEPRKNIINLIAAYRAMHPSLRHTWPLVLVGGIGWRSDDIHVEIQHAVNEGWLKYLGFVPQSDLPFLYAGCRLFTYPSWYEGFGLPIAEAMASGVPVLTSNCSSMPEVAAGCAMLVEPGDIDDIAEKIQFALTNESWRTHAIQSGLLRAAQLTWESCVEKTVDAYHIAEAMK